MKRFVILVADLDMQELIPRFSQVYNQPEVYFEVVRHNERDAGCFNTAHEILRLYINQFDFALVVFDYHGCGQDNRLSRVEVQEAVSKKLFSNGWAGRSKAIVIEPELENWLWTDSAKLYEIIGWGGERDKLLGKFVEKGWLENLVEFQKPGMPKEALEFALQEKGKRFLATIHQKVGAEVSFKNCQDPAFLELVEFLALSDNPNTP